MTKTKPDTMQAAALNQFGGIEAIKMQTLPVPQVGPDEVLIRVEAAGVASWDAMEREGEYDGAFGFESTFPYVLGWDGAGTVAAVGGEVSRFKSGDRVYAATMPLPKGGFYAEYAVVAAEHVSHIPGKLTVEQAGAMPWCALTALSGLEALGLKRGETVMIFGASGGVGHLAVQLAKRMGARVFAVAAGDEGVALAKRLDADMVVDGLKDDVVAAARKFAPDGLDAALITVNAKTVEQALTTLHKGGRVACPYSATLPKPKVGPGIHLSRYNGDTSKEATDKLNRLIELGPFEVHIARTFPLDHAAEAHQALGTHFSGKLVLRVR